MLELLRPLSRGHGATEQHSVEETLALLPAAERNVAKMLARVGPYVDIRSGERVLDVGAAQGLTVIALERAGYEAHGVEPFRDAISVGRRLADLAGAHFSLVPGTAESLPFADGSFALVYCNSVLEHVDDPAHALREALRVLRRGGAYLFLTTSATCPIQREIALMPGFPWYPDRARRAIMAWATEHEPWMVGGTTRPAYHWFHHGEMRQMLYEAGFTRVIDRWEAHVGSKEHVGWRAPMVEMVARNAALRLAGNVLVPDMSFIAIK